MSWKFTPACLVFNQYWRVPGTAWITASINILFIFPQISTIRITGNLAASFGWGTFLQIFRNTSAQFRLPEDTSDSRGPSSYSRGFLRICAVLICFYIASTLRRSEVAGDIRISQISIGGVREGVYTITSFFVLFIVIIIIVIRIQSSNPTQQHLQKSELFLWHWKAFTIKYFLNPVNSFTSDQNGIEFCHKLCFYNPIP